jgi:hypothetical protein
VRRCWRGPGPYLTAAIALAVFAPHALWLARHDFITLHYAAERSADSAGWAGRLKHPAVFLLAQLVRLLPVLVVLWPLLWNRRGAVACGAPRNGRGFLAVVLGPVAVLVLLSLTTGCQLRGIWGSPLWTFAGVALLVAARAAPDAAAVRAAVRNWALVAAALLAFVALKNTAWPHLHGQPTRTHFPGRLLADEVQRRWAERCDRPFPIVAGEPWRAGCICCYSPHRPKLYSSGSMGYLVLDTPTALGSSDDELNARGGVIVWDAGQLGDRLPGWARLRFPSAEDQPALALPYQTGARIPPARVGLAFVWPKE